MKSKIILLFAIAFSIAHPGIAQNDESILLTINEHKVSKAEFERIYKKNNSIENQLDTKSLEEYLELFINFKLKVLEAEGIKLDTVDSFIKELAGYRKQLSKPYMVDKDVDESLLFESFDRLQWDVHAAHILVRLDENASPEDTLRAYNKIEKARQRIFKGESFEKLVKEISEDHPTVIEKGGDLGFFTAFQMVYPFESAAYTTEVGGISKTFRSQFGYHIVKVIEKRKALGQIKVAHIMISVPEGTSKEDAEKAKTKVFEVSAKLKEGADFKQMALDYSDDKGTARKGGELPYFGTGRMVPEFEASAFSLKEIGDVSEPVHTSFGWHIIKLLEKKPIGDFDELKNELKGKISRDARAQKSKKAVVARLKKEYNYTLDQAALNEFYTAVTDSIFKNKWTLDKAVKLNKNLFSFKGQQINQAEFAQFIFDSQRNRAVISLKTYVNDTYDQFCEQKILVYEEEHLEEKYPDFKHLMQEYHDGILLFELTDEMVWSKAVKDTSGLEEFYGKNKTSYMWGSRVDASVYFCKDGKFVDQVRKLAKQRNDKGWDKDKMRKMIEATTKDSTTISFEDRKFSKTDNEYVDSVEWKTGLSQNFSEVKGITFIHINKILPPEPKSLSESKGLVTADYQTYLETKWIEQLRKKYTITIDRDVLSTIH